MIRQIWLLARRDLVQRARTRAFAITVGLSVVVVLAVGPLISLTSGRAEPTTVGVTGPSTAAVAAAVQSVATATGEDVTVRDYADAAAGETAVRAGRAAVLVVTSAPGGVTELVWKDVADPRGETLLTMAVQQVERSRVAAELGLAAGQVSALVAPTPPQSRTLEPADPQRTARTVGATLVVILLYMAIAVFGQFVLLGVMEEKSSRVVEVVLSRARPAEVLAGKVLGIGMLGLLELAALGAAGLVTVRTIDLPGVRLPDLGVSVIASMFVWFILGYGFYAVVYAALGATVSRQEDVQGATFLPTALLLPGYFVGLLVAQDPSDTLSRVASIVPLWSPVVMPARIALGAAAWWEVALAVVLLVVSSAGLIWLGGRIYAGAILRIGRRVRLRDAWRSGGTATAPATPAGSPSGSGSQGSRRREGAGRR